MSTAGPMGRRAVRSWRTLVLLVVSGTLLAAVFAGLGAWQVQRLSWKVDLIQRVEARVVAVPVPAPGPAEWATVEAASHEYRHVTLEGRFLHEREALVQAVTAIGPGFWVVTPLVRPDGTAVLVNRGFVPGERADPATRAPADGQGTVSVTGLLRMSEPDGGFLRQNDPAADRWFSRDVAAIGAARGIRDVAPYFVDADAAPNPGGFPVGGLTVVSFRNHHLVYAVTWFALALMVAAATVFVFIDDRRRRRADEGESRAQGAPS